jgi:hypothetical protein
MSQMGLEASKCFPVCPKADLRSADLQVSKIVGKSGNRGRHEVAARRPRLLIAAMNTTVSAVISQVARRISSELLPGGDWLRDHFVDGGASRRGPGRFPDSFRWPPQNWAVRALMTATTGTATAAPKIHRTYQRDDCWRRSRSRSFLRSYWRAYGALAHL